MNFLVSAEGLEDFVVFSRNPGTLNNRHFSCCSRVQNFSTYVGDIITVGNQTFLKQILLRNQNALIENFVQKHALQITQRKHVKLEETLPNCAKYVQLVPVFPVLRSLF